MVEVVLWVLILVNSGYSGFVTKVDDFASQETCLALAKDLQKRRNTKGTPYCIQGKVMRVSIPKSRGGV